MATRVFARSLSAFFLTNNRLVFGAYNPKIFLPTLTSLKQAPLAVGMTSEVSSRAEVSESTVKEAEEQHRGAEGSARENEECEVTKCDGGELGEGRGVCEDGVSGDDGDKYLYVQRGFTSELFKIEIQNIPKYIGYNELKKKLEKLGLKPVKIKKPQRFLHLPHCFVTFRSEEDREVALKTLEGQVWKNKSITAKVAPPSADPLYRQRERNKRSAGGRDGASSSAKRLHLNEDTATLKQRLDRVVTPLLGTSYESQLAMKAAQMRLALQKAAYLIRKEDSNPGRVFAEQVKLNDGMMCELKPILGSPLQTGYRNKAEMSVGVANGDNTPVVGFRLGSYEEGDFTVASPDDCVHIPTTMKSLCKMFQRFFETSPLSPYTATDESGYWRQVALRCYGTDESMAVVMIHPQNLTNEELATEKQRLIEFFTTGPGTDCVPTSLYIHYFTRRTKEDQSIKLEHLLGKKHVYETLLGMKFRISPDAFFQTNTPATELLYREALPARRVVGVEMNEQAVEDARINAELNGVENVEFVCGKAEDVLHSHLEEEGEGEVIGVVDPPRAGLHPRVVQCIRRNPHIQKLIYVSCNPEGHQTIGNFVDLCRRPSLRVKGAPFTPVMAVPVDLFPQTSHCELIVLFQRNSNIQANTVAS